MEERHKFLTEQLEDLKQDPQGPPRHRPRGRLPRRAGLHRGVRRRQRGLRRDLLPAVPGRRGPAGAHRPRRHAQHRHRGRGPTGRQEGQAALAALRWRALAGRGRFLVALFKARPSPFYILDEVEAALDDTNLGRLLEIYEELRENSQLLVITHQKRTMEVGDALYGVTMRGDGVSAVISQRLREAESSLVRRPPHPRRLRRVAHASRPAGATTTPTATSTTRPTTSSSTPPSTRTSTRPPASTSASCRRSAWWPRRRAATSASSASPRRSRSGWSSTRSGTSIVDLPDRPVPGRRRRGGRRGPLRARVRRQHRPGPPGHPDARRDPGRRHPAAARRFRVVATGVARWRSGSSS